MNRTCTALVLALAACKTPPPPPDGGTAGQLFAHSHNDFEQPRPLLDALDQRFASVEADLWLEEGDLGVSHDGVSFEGTLRSLYLDVLGARAEQNGGSVHGDGQPFFLWLDLKDPAPELRDLLFEQLSGYPMLSRFDDEKEKPGAVVVVLTGSDAQKRALAGRPPPRPYIRDSNFFSADDPPADGRWGYYALRYGLFVSWDGTGELPASERAALGELVASAHQKGRRLRLYGAPETREWWKVARELGLDFIQTDRLAALRAFLEEPP